MYHIAQVAFIEKEVLWEIGNWVDLFEFPGVVGVSEAGPEEIETFFIYALEKIFY